MKSKIKLTTLPDYDDLRSSASESITIATNLHVFYRDNYVDFKAEDVDLSFRRSEILRLEIEVM